jgi:hypothetical protein
VIPGSQEFRAALLSALGNAPAVKALGPVEIRTEERVSRNTVIYRCRAGPALLVAKAQMTKPPEVAAAEYRMLRELQGTFGEGKIRALRPIALIDHLGVVVTHEEAGDTLRSLIERALVSSDRAWDRVTSGVGAAAKALRLFHDRSVAPLRTRPGETDRVRCYMDFSSKNILLRWRDPDSAEPELVLMDPPEEERWGDRTEDIGVFCFDLARVRFHPRFVAKSRVSKRLDWLKAGFIKSYYGDLRSIDLEHTLGKITSAERRRAREALGWYLRPWRYDRMLTEIARLLYLAPLTVSYLAGGSRFSARRVRAFMRVPGQFGSHSDSVSV